MGKKSQNKRVWSDKEKQSICAQARVSGGWNRWLNMIFVGNKVRGYVLAADEMEAILNRIFMDNRIFAIPSSAPSANIFSVRKTH